MRADPTSVLLIVLFAAVACQPAEQAQEGGMEAGAGDQIAKQAIAQVPQREIAATEAGDVEAFLAILTDDAVYLPPGEPAVSGQQALRPWLTEFFENYGVESFSYPESEITVAGEWAFERYEGGWTIVPKDGSEPFSERWKGIHIYRRGADGSWKIAYDIWNSNQMPMASTGEMVEE